MRFPRMAFWSLLLLLAPSTYAQTTSGTIEGLVVSYETGNRSDSTIVESRGKKYQFCLGCPGSLKDSPKIVGDQDIRVRTRVRVTYTNLTRSKEPGVYFTKALVVVNVSSQAQVPPATEFDVPIGRTLNGFTYTPAGALLYKGNAFRPGIIVSTADVREFKISLLVSKNLASGISVDGDGQNKWFFWTWAECLLS